MLTITGCSRKPGKQTPQLPDTASVKEPVSINGFWIDSSEIQAGEPYREFVVDTTIRH